jgi:hypothetical protein
MSIEIINEIQELFFSKLEAKTGWGKNDIKDLYKDCVIEVLTRHIKP